MASTKSAENKPLSVSSYATVAALFGVSRDTVRKDWITRGMPWNNSGGTELRELIAWRIADVQRQVGGGDEGGESLTVLKLKAEVRKLRADATGKEAKNEREAGGLIRAEDSEQAMAELLTLVRTRLESAPDEFEMRFPAETRSENKHELAEFLRGLLKEMSEAPEPAAWPWRDDNEPHEEPDHE